MTTRTIRITRKLPDVLYEVLERKARLESRPVEQVVIEWLAGHPPLPVPNKGRHKRRLAKFMGCYKGNDPHAADNDRIDADLAREYGAHNFHASITYLK